MPISRNAGFHYNLDRMFIQIFGLSGSILDRKRWAMDALLGYDEDGKPVYVAAIVPATSVLTDIENVIRADIANGRGDEIVYVGLSNRFAVILYLEGHLTNRYFENSSEDEDTIRLEGVTFNGREYPVVIRSELEIGYDMATFNERDEIV